MKKIFIALFILISTVGMSQTQVDSLNAKKVFKLNGKRVTAISNDTTLSHADSNKLITEYAAKYLITINSSGGSQVNKADSGITYMTPTEAAKYASLWNKVGNDVRYDSGIVIIGKQDSTNKMLQVWGGASFADNNVLINQYGDISCNSFGSINGTFNLDADGRGQFASENISWDSIGNITANSFIKNGGTSYQFLKADGSVDSNTYLTTSALSPYATTSSVSTALAGKEPTITPPYLAGRFYNGFKNFVLITTDSVPQGITNKYFVAADTIGLAGKVNKSDSGLVYTSVYKERADSGTLAAAIATKGNGTVTSITLGSGMTGSSGTITTSGAIAVDSGSVLILSRDRAAATYATKSKVLADSIVLAAHADADTTGIRPRLVAGTNITIAGTYPNLTIGSSGGSSSLNNGQVGVGNSSNALSGSSALTFSSQVLNNFDTLPEIRLTTAQDSFYSRIQRNYTNHTTYLKAQVNQAGGITNAMNFTGTTKYFSAAETGLPNGTKPQMSISLWFYAVPYPTTAQSNQTLVSYGVTTNPFTINYTNYNNAINITVGLYSGTTSFDIGAPGSVLTNAWNHLVFTCDGANIYVYLNSNQSSLNTTSFTINLGGTLSNRIGWQNNTSSFNSTISQLLIYNTALTQTQVNSIYNMGNGSLIIPYSGLIRQYNLNSIVSSSTPDSNPNSSTHYDATLTGSPTLVSGVILSSSTITEGIPLQYQDGVNANEMGTAYFGDANSGTYLRGLSIKCQEGSYNPFMIGTNRKCYINSSNTSSTALGLSDLSIAGGAAIGATYSTGTAAPTNGLIVQGTTGLGTATPSSSYILDAVGNARITGTSTVTSTSTATTFNSTIAPTAITGAGGSGTAYFSEPFQGTATNGGYKEIMIYLNAFVSSGGTTITYSSSGGIAFTNTPYVYGTASCISQVGTPTATSITITSSTALNGYVFLKGN